MCCLNNENIHINLLFVDYNVTVLLPLCTALMCTVKPEGVPQLCKADEIGELCICSVAAGTSYYGLAGMTKNTFEVSVRKIFVNDFIFWG